jgi:type IV secretion/conjugal transfer VirB4 family ATPase
MNSILFVITSLGLVLLSILFFQVRQEANNARLSSKRKKDQGLADLLNYAATVDDGIVIGKNGAFMASWLYQGEDSSSMPERAQEVLAARLNLALHKMGSGWMIHIDAVRRTSPGYPDKSASHFKDDISTAIDEERRALFERMDTLYESYFVITLTWYPPMIAEKRFTDLMFDDNKIESSSKQKTVFLIDEFKNACRNFESRISLALKIERLGTEKTKNTEGQNVTFDNQLRHLQFCVTGLNHPVLLSKNPIYLDAVIGGQELTPGVIPKLGKKYIQCVAIEGFPLESHPGILTKLSQLPIEYRWSNRFIFMDDFEAKSHFEKFRKKWKQKVRGFFDQIFNTNSGAVDQDALAMVADAEAAIAETNSGMVGQGYYTSVIILMDESRDKLEQASLYMEKSINSLGFAARTETINTMDAFMGSLPGHGYENVRRPLINTMNLADLMPTSHIWAGEVYAPNPSLAPNSPPLMHCVTSGNTPFRLNLHIRDLGHSVILGPTRAGKSTLLAMIAFSWLRYPKARIYAFDKGMSMYPTCKATGGAHYTLADDANELSFAPLQFLDTKEDRAWATDWIDSILQLNGLQTSADQRNEIALAIESMNASRSKNLSEFVVTIQDKAIREHLKQYTVDGTMGHLLDASNDELGLSNFMTFEIDKLMKLKERFALPVLLYLFRRIEKSLDGSPTLIILDEAWLMLAHPIFRAKIAEWLDSMAKLNCSVLMATQHLSHVEKSGIGDIIKESTATKIFLPNQNARDKEAAALYTQMGLNERQIEIIANAVPKQDYYYVSEKGQRLFQLALGETALAFAGSTDVDSINRIKTLEKLHGDVWPNYWLKEKGINNELGVAA